MGRHKKSVDRPCMPDVKYNSKVVSKFVTRMMLDGKKSICTNVLYDAKAGDSVGKTSYDVAKEVEEYIKNK